jgi:exodeoxyribonuclease VII small subunit
MSKSQKSLRELMDEFEAVVAWFDNDDLDVEVAIAKFEEGSKLAEQIKQQLSEAKNKIEIVKKKFDVAESTANLE